MVVVACLSKNQRTGVVTCPNMFRVKEMMSRYHHSSRIQTIHNMPHFQYVQKKHYKKRKEEGLSIKERVKFRSIRADSIILNLWEAPRTLKIRALNSQMRC